jgi:hypothetical protein
MNNCQRVMPKIKVIDMEFIEGNVTKDIAERNGAILSRGGINAYRHAFLKGQGGSAREETWNRKEGIHTCCRSRTKWRHLTSCPKLIFDNHSTTEQVDPIIK